MVTAQLAGVKFDGGDTDSSPYMLTGITGVYDGVGHRRAYDERPTAAGTFPSVARLGGRRITLKGEIYTTGPMEQDRAIRRLTGLLASGETGTLAVDMGNAPITAIVQRLGTPVISIDAWGLLATFELQLWADDPRWYGKERTVGPAGAVAAINRGNFPALPVLVVTGSSPGGYTITGPNGGQIIVNAALTSGVPHEYRMREARLYVGGSRVLGGVTRARLWAVRSGLPTTTMTVSAGQLTSRLNDTYL